MDYVTSYNLDKIIYLGFIVKNIFKPSSHSHLIIGFAIDKNKNIYEYKYVEECDCNGRLDCCTNPGGTSFAEFSGSYFYPSQYRACDIPDIPDFSSPSNIYNFNRWRVYVLRQLEKWGEMKSPEQESYFCENIN